MLMVSTMVRLVNYDECSYKAKSIIFSFSKLLLTKLKMKVQQKHQQGIINHTQ